MRVAATQSIYLPWQGFFDIIASVDLFILYDDVAYSRGSWRNRNRLKARQGPIWLTVPVRSPFGIPIDQVQIANQLWQAQHYQKIRECLREAPYYNDAIEVWTQGIAGDTNLISHLNQNLIQVLCAYLGITTPIIQARTIGGTGAKQDRLLDVLAKVGATSYLSGPAGQGYLEPEQFQARDIRLFYKTYDYEPYNQLFGGFVPQLSVLDLIANLGPDAKKYLQTLSPDLEASA